MADTNTPNIALLLPDPNDPRIKQLTDTIRKIRADTFRLRQKAVEK
jgi:hypothetical protein